MVVFAGRYVVLNCVGILRRSTVKGHNASLSNVSGFVEYTCVTSDALSLSAKSF